MLSSTGDSADSPLWLSWLGGCRLAALLWMAGGYLVLSDRLSIAARRRLGVVVVTWVLWGFAFLPSRRASSSLEERLGSGGEVWMAGVYAGVASVFGPMALVAVLVFLGRWSNAATRREEAPGIRPAARAAFRVGPLLALAVQVMRYA